MAVHQRNFDIPRKRSEYDDRCTRDAGYTSPIGPGFQAYRNQVGVFQMEGDHALL